MMYNDFFAGIDLGTTNSAIAIAEPDGNQLNTPIIPISRFTGMGRSGRSRQSANTLPSAVLYQEDKNGNYQTFVGDCAAEAAILRPYAVALSVKEQMGQPHLTYPGWRPEYPDQSPQQVNARILNHLLDGIEDMYGERPTKAVITVPASYSAIKRQATLQAAELAGLNVKGPDGSYLDNVILSEPEAVLYHVLNEKQNGRLSLKCDFHTPKRVLVYDIGGGTLDISLTEVVQRSNGYDMKLIATNRFSSMAGNAFDRSLADAMYRKYIQELELEQPEFVANAKQNESIDRIQFERMAEAVKVNFSDRVSHFRKRGTELPPEAYEAYGSPLSGGRNVESSITRKEFEDFLRPYLGLEYTYQDYKRFDQFPERQNILYPVLQVLSRAAKKLGTSDLKVDMVLLNGGMSRFYLICDRLKDFFGFPMTAVSNPDTSVAAGAAVYHYYCAEKGMAPSKNQFQSEADSTSSPKGAFHPVCDAPAIRTLGTVLPDNLFIGTSGGANILIAEAGMDLPYEQINLPAFTLPAGRHTIEIPLRERHGSEYVTVGRGKITFANIYSKSQPLHLRIHISRSSILSLDAQSPTEIGRTEILFGDGQSSSRQNGTKLLLPPKGVSLLPENELSSLQNLVTQLDDLVHNRKLRKQPLELKKRKNKLIGRIEEKKTFLADCGNPEDFAEPLLSRLEGSINNATAFNLLSVAKTLCSKWTAPQRRKLSRVCIHLLGGALTDCTCADFRIKAECEAIQAIGACGIPEDIQKLDALQNKERYRDALALAQQLFKNQTSL